MPCHFSWVMACGGLSVRLQINSVKCCKSPTISCAFLQGPRAIHRPLPGRQRSRFPRDATSWRTSPSRHCGNPHNSGIQAKDVWQEADSNAGHRGKSLARGNAQMHLQECQQEEESCTKEQHWHTQCMRSDGSDVLTMDKNKTKFGELTHDKLEKHAVFYTALQFLHYPFAISTRGWYLILICLPQLHRQHDFHRESK